MRLRRSACGLLTALTLLCGTAHATDAGPTPRSPAIYSLTEENDGIFSHQDRHYTQGLRLSRTAVPDAGGFWDGLSDKFGAVTAALGAGPASARRDQWLFGQNEFTPTDITRSVPDPLDRPYAGWLYLGAGLMQRSASGRIDHLQVLLGVVGPAALAKQVQDGFHSFAGYGQANGYHYQLHNEPGLMVSYQTIWDRPLLHLGPVQTELLPELGITAGNLLTYGEVGLTLRAGQDLGAAGTPQTITPGLSGSGWFDPTQMDGAFGWMVFAGIQTRAVWRNLFLEGNSYQASPGVQKRNFVTDEDAGISLMFHFGLRVDISYIKRTREFSGQVNDDRFGSVTLSAPF